MYKRQDLIDGEIKKVEEGKEGYIGMKFNSLTDKVLIEKVMEAAQKGVKIDLVIRGICCLIAGVKGYTENITVKSIVGRYLEPVSYTHLDVYKRQNIIRMI